MIKKIIYELKEHSPFTLLGALIGIIFMMMFKNMPYEASHRLFYIFHPLHVFLSAIVTTALFCRYQPKEKISGIHLWKVLVVGLVGSIGIGTLSDSVVPFWGEILLDMPHRHIHIGIIEEPWIISLSALAGIVLAYFKPSTKHPHAGHVLVSTWASLFHMLMASSHSETTPYFGIFIFLFLAVWVPCCLSDIIFPMLFAGDVNASNPCDCCGSKEKKK